MGRGRPPRILTEGMRFGRLIVTDAPPVIMVVGNRKQRAYLCICDCGEKKLVQMPALTRGECKSCGCFNRETLSSRAQTHGRSKTRTYRKWLAMKARCNGKNAHNAKYTERGIKVCDRWRSFENFLADMGECPDGMTLERERNDGDYEPSNCRWATPIEQQRNRTGVRHVTIDGISGCVAEHCTRLGVPYDMVEKRIYRGWDPVRAIMTPRISEGRPARPTPRP